MRIALPKMYQRNAQMEVDPTHTATLRRTYSGKCAKRFRSLKGLIRTSVVENNALKLGDYTPHTLSVPLKPDDYKFTQDAKKITAFRNWLQGSVDDDVLEVMARDGATIVNRNPWQNEYIRKGYSKGVKHAESSLKESGISIPDKDLQNTLNAPMHQSTLQSLYTRNFTELQGITKTMDQQISRELANGFSQGWNPRKMAKKINGRVDKIGITRARTLARTETIRAHSEGTLNRFEQAGVEETTAKAEWQTAGDNRVCPICASYAGTVYKLKDARGVIPRHPNCRCAWLPVTGTYTG